MGNDPTEVIPWYYPLQFQNIFFSVSKIGFPTTLSQYAVFVKQASEENNFVNDKISQLRLVVEFNLSVNEMFYFCWVISGLFK